MCFVFELNCDWLLIVFVNVFRRNHLCRRWGRWESDNVLLLNIRPTFDSDLLHLNWRRVGWSMRGSLLVIFRSELAMEEASTIDYFRVSHLVTTDPWFIFNWWAASWTHLFASHIHFEFECLMSRRTLIWWWTWWVSDIDSGSFQDSDFSLLCNSLRWWTASGHFATWSHYLLLFELYSRCVLDLDHSAVAQYRWLLPSLIRRAWWWRRLSGCDSNELLSFRFVRWSERRWRVGTPRVTRTTRSNELNMLQRNFLRLWIVIAIWARPDVECRCGLRWATRVTLPCEELLNRERGVLLSARLSHCHLNLVRCWLRRMLWGALRLVLGNR